MAPAGDEHGVVEAGAALGAVEDTTSVVLEDGLVGLDGDSEGLGGEGGLHLGDVVGGDEVVVRDVDSGGAALVVLAGAGSSVVGGVWVDALELGLAGFPVLEGLVLPATVAAVVGGGAVNELLLREGEELASVDLVDTLEGTSGGERPAGAAVSLILDGGDGTSGLPVGVAVGGALIEALVGAWHVHLGSVSEHLLVLNLGEVREEVVASGEVGVLSVDLVDLLLSLNKVSEAGHELLNGGVLLAPLSGVLHVLELHVGDLCGDDASEKSQSE